MAKILKVVKKKAPISLPVQDGGAVRGKMYMPLFSQYYQDLSGASNDTIAAGDHYLFQGSVGQNEQGWTPMTKKDTNLVGKGGQIPSGWTGEIDSLVFGVQVSANYTLHNLMRILSEGTLLWSRGNVELNLGQGRFWPGDGGPGSSNAIAIYGQAAPTIRYDSGNQNGVASAEARVIFPKPIQLTGNDSILMNYYVPTAITLDNSITATFGASDYCVFLTMLWGTWTFTLR